MVESRLRAVLFVFGCTPVSQSGLSECFVGKMFPGNLVCYVMIAVSQEAKSSEHGGGTMDIPWCWPASFGPVFLFVPWQLIGFNKIVLCVSATLWFSLGWPVIVLVG